MAKWQDTFEQLKKRKKEIDKTSNTSEIKQVDKNYQKSPNTLNYAPIRSNNGLKTIPTLTNNTSSVTNTILGINNNKSNIMSGFLPNVTSNQFKAVKPTVESSTPSKVEPTISAKTTQPVVNAEGYKETGKTYGDYWYQEYTTRKDDKIYEKDGQYYLYDAKTGNYQSVDQVSYMTTKEASDKAYKEAKKSGYKGNRSSLAHISDQLKLDTSNLTDKEYKEYQSDLKRQQDKSDKELSRKSRINYGGAGLKGSLGVLKQYAQNLGDLVDDNIITPAKSIDDIYESGKKNNELALEYYKKMEGKSNKVDELKEEADTYNKFNQDLLSGDVGWLGQAVQNANTQVESIKHQGIAATILGVAGAGIGYAVGKGKGAVAGAKIGGGIGYTVGATPYTYKLEAGNQYQALTEMGVPDKIAKKYSKITGGINAGIESGENIIDLATLGLTKFTGKGATAVSKEAVKEMVDDYGEDTVKKWLTGKIGEKATNTLILAGKSYAQNIGSEALEESLQETTSIANERLATKEAGIKREATTKDDIARILEAGKTAAISTAFTAPLTSLGGSIVTNTINNIESKVSNKINSKISNNTNTITDIELNNEIATEIENSIKNSNESLTVEEVQQIQAEVQQQLIDDGIEISNTTTQETNSNLATEVESNTLNIDNDNQNNYNVNKLEGIYGKNQQNQEYTTSTNEQGTDNTISRGTNGIFEQNDIKQTLGEDVSKRKFTREEYKQYEKELNNSKSVELNNNQLNLQNKVKTKSGKDIVFFNGKQLYKGGSSLENRNVIYVSSELNDNGQSFVSNHEIMESEIMHNKEFRENYAKDVINEIINDKNFSKARENFIGNDSELNNVSDYLIAKDILADIYAERETGINKGYEAILSDDTNNFINYTIDRLNEGFSKNEQSTKIRENGTPNQQELDSLENIRKNKSGSEYASTYYDLEKKYGKANLIKGLNEYKSTGKALNTERVIKQVSKQVEDVIAPIKESINELKDTIAEVKKVSEETKALTEQDLPMVETKAKDNLQSAIDEDIASTLNETTQDNAIAPIKENVSKNVIKNRYEAIEPNKINENKYEDTPMIRVKPDRETFDKAVMESAKEIEKELGYTPKNPTKESSYDLTDTSENQKIAKILTEEPKVAKRKQRLWATMKANLLDKGAVFEDVSIKTKNRDLMGKWDYTLTSEARAQNVIGNGHTEYDPITKTTKQTSKSLNDIVAEVENTGLKGEFYDYVYHKHNIDRMNLESKAKERIIDLNNMLEETTNKEEIKDIKKQIKSLEKTANKPVFGDSITSEVSQRIVEQYENENPLFMDYAQDVYDYVNADRQQLVKEGVISKETADLWSEMYPHYVPIRREDTNGNNINVPLDTGRTGVNAPIKKATGGSSNILPLFDTMAMRTLQTYRATAKNSFGVELKNTLGTIINNQQTNIDDVINSVDNQESLLQEGKNGSSPTFTVFENGEKVTYEITQDMYNALKPLSDSDLLSKTIKPLNVASSFHRGVLTEYNPVFMLTNSIKDAQDVLMNSQHAAKTYAKMPEAYAQILKKGYWYQEYISNGGEQNSYFDSQENTFKTENKGIKKLLDIPPLSTISKLNNIIEMAPRLSEYIASREQGRSVEVSMLDAARVTTNFKAGGNVTKAMNRNGFTFLNASVQGAMQQVRNIREANMNGLRGWANLATKFTIAGLPAILLNGLVWGDDNDYDEQPDYVKQNYYVVWKKGDGTFIKIPKGRTVAVIQEAIKQVDDVRTGNDEADLKGFLDLVLTNLAPNNPIDNNILSPITQVMDNKTWYDEDLIPTRLQDLPANEQYDESTDVFSRWLGNMLNVSPIKINYLLNQYSGGVGDVVLPMITPKATNDADSIGDYLIAPFKDKFTTNATMNNKNPGELFETSEKLTTNAKKSKATDEDVLKNKFINSIRTEMNELYKQKREIQNSNLSKGEKYEQVLEIQSQINELSKYGLNNYEDVNISGNYATVGNRQYKLNSNNEWEKINEKQVAKQEEVSKLLNISASDYWGNKDEYDYAYENPDKYKTITAITDYDTYKTYSSDINDLKSDKDDDGKSISGSRKEKVISYVNSLDLSIPQKAMIIRQAYSTFDDYNDEIVDYVSSLDVPYEDKVSIFKGLDMIIDDEGYVYW